MFKKNIGKSILSSVVTLLPMVFGFAMWDRLPDSLATHWGADGNVDGISSKIFAVVGLPLILLLVHALMLLFLSFSKETKTQNQKVLSLCYWIIPILSLFANGITYAAALEKEFEAILFMPLLLGALFFFMGNYLPKTRQNHSFGIKLPWTFGNEENWNKTHRLGGKVWAVCGLALCFSALFPTMVMVWVALAVILLAVIIPTVYSYALYKKHQKQGIAYETSLKKSDKVARKITAIVLPIILIGVMILMFTGNIAVQYGDTSFTVKATYWNDLTVEYTAVDSIEYRETLKAGTRTYGFASARLSLGHFQNEEFGSYTRFAYTGKSGAVVLTVDQNTLVIVGKTPAETKEIYQQIASKKQK